MRRAMSTWHLCIALSGLAACGSADLIRDPALERWCGSQPCEWQVEGSVQRVGTWHTDDYALQLLSDDARIWQDNGTATSESSRCFEFGMVAQIDRDTRVFLELDFLADGSVEFSQRLPPSRWERLTFRITAPTWYRGVRFSLRKDGPGRAILAELSALNAPGTCTAPPIELHDRPARATCSTDGARASASPCRGFGWSAISWPTSRARTPRQ